MKKETISFEDIKIYVEEIVKDIAYDHGGEHLNPETKKLLKQEYITKEKTDDIDEHSNRAQSSDDMDVYRITLKNLTIKVSEHDNAWKLSIDRINQWQEQRAYIYELSLENIEFITNGETCLLKINAMGSRFLSIYESCFENIDLIIATQSLKNFSIPSSEEVKNYTHLRNIRISIENSTFGYLKIFARSSSGNQHYQFCQFYLSKNEIKELLIEALKSNNYELKFINQNEVGTIQIHGEYPKVLAWGMREKINPYDIKETYLEKNNDFYSVEQAESLTEIIENNKFVFINFRKQAIEEGNRLHEILFQHHITECDETLIGLEPNKSSWQEKTIMWLGRKISNHGTSWLRPIVHIAWINLIIAIVAALPIMHIFSAIILWMVSITLLAIYVAKISSSILLLLEKLISTARKIFSAAISLSKKLALIGIFIILAGFPNSLYYFYQHLAEIPYSGFLRLYFELFNPLVTLNNIADKSPLLEPSWWLAFLTIINKLTYAICAYEFIRAARRFTPR